MAFERPEGKPLTEADMEVLSIMFAEFNGAEFDIRTMRFKDPK